MPTKPPPERTNMTRAEADAWVAGLSSRSGESPQDREDRISQRILAIFTVVLTGVIAMTLLFRGVPSENEILIGTVVGFIFGNMTGPVFRKIFGGPDAGTRQVVAQAAQNATNTTETK